MIYASRKRRVLGALRPLRHRVPLHTIKRPQEHLFLTDNGSLIIDVTLEDRDVAELACEINDVAGVIDHGLFLDEADEILVDTPRGIEKMVRPEA